MKSLVKSLTEMPDPAWSRSQLMTIIDRRDRQKIESLAQSVAGNLELTMHDAFANADIGLTSGTPYNDRCWDLFRQLALAALSKRLKANKPS